MSQQPAEAVRETLATGGPATAPELAARLGVHPATVERCCRTLQRRGEIRQGTGGQYVLTDRSGGHAASD